MNIIESIKKDLNSFEVSTIKDRIGIKDGLVGSSILYCLLGKYLKDDRLIVMGRNIWDEIPQPLPADITLDFAKGLAGIGWALETLAQNQIIQDVNTDEMLEDFDALFYKYTIYSPEQKFDSIIGAFAYFNIRRSSVNLFTHPHKRIGILPCVNVLAEEICDYLNEKCNNIFHEKKQTLKNIGTAIYFLSKLTKSKSIIKNIGESLFKIISNLVALIDKEHNIKEINEYSNEYIISYQYLLLCIAIAGKYNMIRSWYQTGIKLYIETQKTIVNDSKIMDQNARFQLLNVISIYSLLVEKQKYKREFKNILHNINYTKERKTINGVGRVLVPLMVYDMPEIVNSPIELIILLYQL